MLKFLPNPEEVFQTHQRLRHSFRHSQKTYNERLSHATQLPVNLIPIFVGQITRRGLRTRALTIFLKLVNLMRLSGIRNPFQFMFQRLSKVRSIVSFRVCKRKNRVLRLPYLLKTTAEWRMAVSNVVQAARRRRERTMEARLFAIFKDLANDESPLLAQKKEDERNAIQNMMYFRYTRKWKFSKKRVS